jgi:hypothetical protein
VVIAVIAGGMTRAAIADGEDHDVRLADHVQLTAGATGVISLTIAPRARHTISRDGPVIVELSVEPANGLDLPRRRYRRADAADVEAEAPRFDLALRARQPGSYRLRVRARFWVCARRTCRPVREERTVAVDVAASPPDAGPAS